MAGRRKNTWDMYDAIDARNRSDKFLDKQIKKVYEEALNDIKKKTALLKGKDNVSAILRTQYLNKLEKQIRFALKEVDNKVITIITNEVKTVSEAVVKEAVKFNESVGLLCMKGSMSYVPQDVIKNIIYGNVYETKTPLSERIWSNNKKQLSDINSIIAKGIAENMSVYDIAKDLEKYVDPKAKKDWRWSKVYPGTNKRIDYNAQRLARTMIQHAYQQSFVNVTKKNPFVGKYKWNSAMVERSCQLCKDRDGQLFDKDKLPLDHPNGLCTVTAVLNADWETIEDKIAEWYKSPEGTFPDIDEYAKDVNARMPFKTIKVEGKEPVKQKVNDTVIKPKTTKTKSQKKIDYNKELEKILSKRKDLKMLADNLKKTLRYEEFIDAYEKYDDDYKMLFNFMLKNTKVKIGDIDKGAYFLAADKSVHMSEGCMNESRTLRTLFHEFGHAVDYYTGVILRKEYKVNAPDGRVKASYSFLKDMVKDFDNYIKANSKFKNYKEAFYNDENDTSYSAVDLRVKLKNDFSLMSNDTMGVQDAVRGLSNAKVMVKWGHSKDYYKRSEYGVESSSESFAQYSSDIVCNKYGKESFEKLFPKWTDKYHDMIKEAAEKLKENGGELK